MNFLIKLLEKITRHERYKPTIEWSNQVWIFNIFRFYEYIFGRGVGIRPETSSAVEIKNGKLIVVHEFFTLEALLVHIEITIRGYFYLFWAFFKSLFTFQSQPKLDYRPVYLTLGILGLIFSLKTSTKFLPLFGLAIAYDATGQGTALGGTSLTYAHTCTGSDRIILTGASIESGSDLVTGITYNAVSQSRIDLQPGNSETAYLYDLIAPATGANNVVVSTSSAVDIRSCSVSYSGAKQSAQPDASNKGTSGLAASITVSVTTIADNCWLVSYVQSNGSGGANALTAGTGTTKRTNTSYSAIGDSNGAKTPAGAYSMQWTNSPNTAFNMVLASIAPAGNVYTQVLTENPTFTDILIKGITRNLSENPTFTDILIKGITRNLSEVATFTETFLRSITKNLVETITFADTLIKGTSRTLTETVTFTVTLTKGTTKVLTETAIFTISLVKRVTRTAVNWIKQVTSAGGFTKQTPSSSNWTKENPKDGDWH